MRVVVVGATGNIGTSVLRSLEKEDSVESVLGLARRLPNLPMPKVEWASADVVTDDLVPHLRGADAVVLLAWIIQPSRDLTKQWMVNVEGSMRVARAAKEAGTPALIYASSVGAYSPGPKNCRVDESWPTRATKPRSSGGSTASSGRRPRSGSSGCAPGSSSKRRRPRASDASSPAPSCRAPLCVPPS